MSTQQRLARFGTFEFDLDTLELRRQGRRVSIEPQPARALALLIGSAGHVVSRQALKQAVWKDDVHVDFDRGLAYVISQVRAALGDSAENPLFVETIPRFGFRFIAPLTPPPLSTPAPAGAVADKSHPLRSVAALALVAILIAALTFALVGKRPVLAVAIFDNETGQPAYDGFTSGIADALIARLATLDAGRIGVIGNARTLRMPRSERDLNQIKTETGASFILLGQLQNHDGGVRLITHLIRLDDGTHVWVKRFDRPAGGLDGLEAEVLRLAEAGVRLHVMGEIDPSAVPSSAAPSR